MEYKINSINIYSESFSLNETGLKYHWLTFSTLRTNSPAPFEKEKLSVQAKEPSLGPKLYSWKQFQPALFWGGCSGG